jgi:hypothetical protein
VTEADLRGQTHGLFEWFLLNSLASVFLPYEGDVEAAATQLWAEMAATVDDLPESSFPAASKSALKTLIGELPNPSGVLTLQLRSEAGIGPARLAGYAMTGVPDSLEDAEPLMDGVTVDIGWTHEKIR